MSSMLARWPFLQTLPSVGVAISNVFVAVSIRSDPARVTGVFRSRLGPPGVELGPDRRALVSQAAAEAAQRLRLPEGTSVVLAAEPEERILRLSLVDGWCQRPVRVVVDHAAVAGLADAGLVAERLDLVPAALARLTAGSSPQGGRIFAAAWAVSATADRIEAAADPPGWMSEAATTGGQDAGQVTLGGIHLPATVRRHINLATDAVAIGAALRGLGLAPDLIVEPVNQVGPGSPQSAAGDSGPSASVGLARSGPPDTEDQASESNVLWMNQS